ncbi:MAG: peptidase M30, partial [Spirochaetia bacterium]
MNGRLLPCALSAAAACALLLSCTPLTGPLPSGMAAGPEVQHVPYTGSFTYTVDPGQSPRDVYFVFTNPSLDQDMALKPSVSSQSIKVDGVALPAPASQPLPSENSAPQTLADRIAEFNRDPFSNLVKFSLSRPSGSYVSDLPAQADQANITTGTFYALTDPNATALSSVPATCRAVVGPVDLGDGRTRALSIWVGDANWGTDVNAAMVAALAARFLQDPASVNDIYHWDTAAVGEPWGPAAKSPYISWDSNNTITILLTELNTDYSASVIVGYFWAKDNFTATALPGSNQRIMFYIDSKLYGSVLSTETSWADTDFWPKLVFSTLAHEFQHMIQFYQKQVVHNLAASTDTWINEMCSMIMEDLVADKLNIEGPRGVITADGSAGPSGITDGRIPDFNQDSYYRLAVTSKYDVYDYSTSYAFGAWLARNYGGAELLQRIVQCPQTDSTAVVNAAAAASGKTESMERLLEKWSAAVLISDTTAAPPGYRYNTGAWSTSSAGGMSYNLGSIDIFNYTPALLVFNSNSQVFTAPYYSSSNVYFLAASKLAAAK